MSSMTSLRLTQSTIANTLHGISMNFLRSQVGAIHGFQQPYLQSWNNQEMCGISLILNVSTGLGVRTMHYVWCSQSEHLQHCNNVGHALNGYTPCMFGASRSCSLCTDAQDLSSHCTHLGSYKPKWVKPYSGNLCRYDGRVACELCSLRVA